MYPEDLLEDRDPRFSLPDLSTIPEDIRNISEAQVPQEIVSLVEFYPTWRTKHRFFVDEVNWPKVLPYVEKLKKLVKPYHLGYSLLGHTTENREGTRFGSEDKRVELLVLRYFGTEDPGPPVRTQPPITAAKLARMRVMGTAPPDPEPSQYRTAAYYEDAHEQESSSSSDEDDAFDKFAAEDAGEQPQGEVEMSTPQTHEVGVRIQRDKTSDGEAFRTGAARPTLVTNKNFNFAKRSGRPKLYPFEEMNEVGDAMLVKNRSAELISATVSNQNKLHPYKTFRRFSVPESGGQVIMLIWVAGKDYKWTVE